MLLVFAVVIAASLVAGATSTYPGLYRPLFAITILSVLVAVATRRPDVAAVGCLLFLPVLALIRRLLIADSGWSAYDPLILVGPLLAIVVVVRLFVLDRRPVAPDRLSQLVVFFLCLSAAQVVNPLGGGVVTGVGGLLFIAAPVLWFLVGRELAERRHVLILLIGMVALGTAIGVYGLFQTQVGLPSWDKAWLDVTGYSSLNVGDEVRAFGTFSSAAEYALWTGSALVVCFALALHRRSALLLAAPVLATALFLASARGALILSALAIIVVAGVRSGRTKLAVVVIAIGIAGAFVGLKVYGGAAQQAASNSGNDLVSHQVGGVTDPLNSKDSTLLTHVDLVISGVERGVTHPIGSGTGATNLAASKFGGGSGEATEVDVSNAFVALGLPGGVAFLGILILGFGRTVRRYFEGEQLALGVLGILVVTAGQWLTGGHYALAPLEWFLLGWIVSAREPPLPARG